MTENTGKKELSPSFIYVENENELPAWANVQQLAMFLHEKMKPYHDTLTDVTRALEYAFSDIPGKGGFVVLAGAEDQLLGAVVILKTGMGGYIPENMLVFVVVDPQMRGKGLGRQIIEYAINKCDGDVKLHVEMDNPAKRLYERIGFTHKYAEMRYKKHE